VPDDAFVPLSTRRLLGSLAARFEVVALLSGRSIDSMVRMVPATELLMIGNHGLEWKEGPTVRDADHADGYRAAIGQLAAELQPDLPRGVFVEPKGLSVSLHYRAADNPDAVREDLLRLVQPQLADRGLRLQEGRRVIDLRPDLPADKGSAVADLVSEIGRAHV